MPSELLRTAQFTYDDGSEKIFRVHAIRSDDIDHDDYCFLSLSANYSGAPMAIDNREQVEGLITALRSAARELWPEV